MLMTRGQKVKRGRNWKWGDQDGNGLGTVVEPVSNTGSVRVQWDNGHINVYRMGYEDQFDLTIASDNATGRYACILFE